MTLFPVVMPVHFSNDRTHNCPCPSCLKSGSMSGPKKVDRLSLIAREALKLSAEKSGVRLGELRQDENGVPCPVSGNYWSVSHKPKYVAAVVSKSQVGIDIEEMKPRTQGLFPHLATDEEWKLADKSWDTFFRYWTAKEATLKAIGIGISGLKKCRIISIPDENHIILDYKRQFFVVEQLRHNNHIVSIVQDNNQVEWVVLGAK